MGKIKVGTVSDIHMDFNKTLRSIDGMLEDMSEVLKSEGYSHLIIVGDISSNYKETIQWVNRLREQSGVDVRYVLGNHDVYNIFGNSETAYIEMAEDKNSLHYKVLDLGEWVIVGGYSWYDYTLETLGKNAEFYHKSRRMYWNDSKYVKWGVNGTEMDTVFCSDHIEKLDKLLSGVNENKKIILANHFVPSKDFVVVKEGNESWNICNAFMGTEKLQDLIQNYNVKKYLFGHTHNRFGKVKKGNVEYICTPLGYYREWETRDFKEEFKKALIELDI